jgi:subfamily B ATP-binding cassette protein MsbA
VEAITGIRVVKAFNLESRQLDRFREFPRKLVHHGMKGVQAKELANPLIEVIAAIGVGALVVYLFWSQQTLDDLVTFVTGLVLFFTPVKKIAAVHILFEQASAGIDRLVELLNEKPSISEPARPRPLKTFERGITFESVSFSLRRQAGGARGQSQRSARIQTRHRGRERFGQKHAGESALSFL